MGDPHKWSRVYVRRWATARGSARAFGSRWIRTASNRIRTPIVPGARYYWGRVQQNRAHSLAFAFRAASVTSHHVRVWSRHDFPALARLVEALISSGGDYVNVACCNAIVSDCVGCRYSPRIHAARSFTPISTSTRAAQLPWRSRAAAIPKRQRDRLPTPPSVLGLCPARGRPLPNAARAAWEGTCRGFEPGMNPVKC